MITFVMQWILTLLYSRYSQLFVISVMFNDHGEKVAIRAMLMEHLKDCENSSIIDPTRVSMTHLEFS